VKVDIPQELVPGWKSVGMLGWGTFHTGAQMRIDILSYLFHNMQSHPRYRSRPNPEYVSGTADSPERGGTIILKCFLDSYFRILITGTSATDSTLVRWILPVVNVKP